MPKEKWSFKTHTFALADTGDYEGYVQFTNGKDIFQTSGDELEEEQMQEFCELLDLMPDLWSHKCDNAEFELSQIRKKSEHFEKALKTIRDAFYTDGETDKENIAFDAEDSLFLFVIIRHPENLLSDYFFISI